MRPSNDLHRRDLLDLTGAGALTAFFERLGYTADRLEQLPENLGITSEASRRPIRRVERLVRHGDPILPIEVYLFELSKVTLTHTRVLAKAFRDRIGYFLLVLTSDWQRLDFVYVERQAPDLDEPQKGLRGRERARVRPRILTIDRRDPHRVGLRVLRRLRWSAEDTVAQEQKILSAYNVGDWSEELFNNRALFSDHYLNNSLPDDPSWRDDPKPVLRDLTQAFKSVSDSLTHKTTAEMRTAFLGPVLRTLGFYFNAKRGTAPPKARKENGYRLYAADGTAVAFCLDCPWGRYLDGKDEKLDAENAEDNPSVRVVQAFEAEDGKAEVDWVILTNGQIWRVYGRRAHSRATHYYEIDLPELLFPGDAVQALDAFRFFWLLFRRPSFERQPTLREGQQRDESLADRLLIDSQAYAKELGERLKETVFEDVFPDLAQGFLRSVASDDDLFSQDQLDAAFRGTLAFLYRTLFLLYAEARNLLPVHEVHDYLEISLKRIRDEVAEAGGVAASDRDRRLAQRYGGDTFTLYDRLQRLFRTIDLGDPAVNVPTYNGGLFVSEPDDDDLSPEAEAARFLNHARVDDATLARALDRLARAEDQKQTELVFIDYRSLGVRQLGSIYEGLLEFRLRVAREDMAVVAQKKKSGNKKIEKVVPLDEARDEKKYTILRTGRGKDAAERILHPGDVYLENDKGERKSTGSYYTPDFVVEYLVGQTLEPLLAEKLDGLRPALRRAQSWQRKMKKMAEQKGEPPQKYVAGPAIDGEWGELVDEFFNFKVLDPAMGSGHFLVEAVDFITDRMLKFLAAFPWNPVFAYLESTRRTITAAMEKHEIIIPEERLTDVNLLKRHVLKRCIYGVDLNPMAVELAKVSLWLDCFTLGAPLSFLDHHLRCGNSLLGVTIDEVRKEVEEKDGEGRSQMTLFTSRFAALKLATAAMAAVGAMPDVTAEQVRDSRREYRSATNALAQYHRLLDVWCSQWFVEPPIRTTEAIPKKKPVKERVVQYLKAEALKKYFETATDDEAASELAKLEAKDKDYLEAVVREAKERRFFHWEIEFPEVFYRRKPGTQRQAERTHGQEFDAVVGNPPWVRQEGLKDLKKAFRDIFPETFASEADIYVYVVARALQVLRRGGRFGMILQNKWFKTEYAGTFREHLSDRFQPLEVVDFGHAPLFPDADTFPCTLLVLKPSDEADYDEVAFFDVAREDLPGIDLTKYGARARSFVPRQRLRKTGWELLPKPLGDLMEKIRNAGVPLSEFVGSSPLYGIKTGFNEAFLIDQAKRDELVEKDPACEEIIKPFLRGENVRRWQSPWGGEWMIFARRGINIEDYPVVREHLNRFRKRLEPRPRSWDSAKQGAWKGRKPGSYRWYELQDTIDYYETFEAAKIVYQDIAFHSGFSLESSSLYANNTCYIIPSGNLTLLAVLNSSVAWRFFESDMQKAKDGAYRLHNIYLENFPVPASRHYRAEIEEITQSISNLTASFLERERDYEAMANIVNKHSKNAQTWKLSRDVFESRFRNHAKIGELSAVREILRQSRVEICRLELEMQEKVFRLYGLNPAEVDLLRKTAPPRDPLTIAEQDLLLLRTG